jgi:hypothetical protein
MKKLLQIVISAFLAIVALNRCSSDPQVAGYISPARLVSQITSADRIVVVSTFHNMSGASHFASFRAIITGSEMNSIIRAISSLRAPTCDLPTAPSDCLYDWQLQFYRGAKLLGTADLADCLVRCDGVEYDAPEMLKSLYHRIARQSGEED